MQDEKPGSDSLFRYILGDLTEAEQMCVEEEYFADAARQQELWAVFDDVAEQFLQGELAAADAQKFAARLQASPLLRERVARLHALLHTLAAQATPTALPTPQKVSLRWANWFFWPAWQAGLAATALVLVALGFLWWSRKPVPPVKDNTQAQPSVARTSNSSSPAPTASVVRKETPKPTAESKVRPMTPPRTGSAQVATFFLMQEITRDQSAATPLTITKSVEVLELQLEVRPPLYPDYQVIVQTAAGQTLVTAQKLRPHRHERMEFLRVRIPVAKLPEEAFNVHINGLPAGQEPKLVGSHSLQLREK